jgi:hypothetical protein
MGGHVNSVNLWDNLKNDVQLRTRNCRRQIYVTSKNVNVIIVIMIDVWNYLTLESFSWNLFFGSLQKSKVRLVAPKASFTFLCQSNDKSSKIPPLYIFSNDLRRDISLVEFNNFNGEDTVKTIRLRTINLTVHFSKIKYWRREYYLDQSKHFI